MLNLDARYASQTPANFHNPNGQVVSNRIPAGTLTVTVKTEVGALYTYYRIIAQTSVGEIQIGVADSRMEALTAARQYTQSVNDRSHSRDRATIVR